MHGLITKKDTATSGTIIIFLEPISIVCCGVNGAVLLKIKSLESNLQSFELLRIETSTKGLSHCQPSFCMTLIVFKGR